MTNEECRPLGCSSLLLERLYIFKETIALDSCKHQGRVLAYAVFWWKATDCKAIE